MSPKLVKATIELVEQAWITDVVQQHPEKALSNPRCACRFLVQSYKLAMTSHVSQLQKIQTAFENSFDLSIATALRPAGPQPWGCRQIGCSATSALTLIG